MNPYTRFEIKAASAVMGLLMLCMALVVGSDNSADTLHLILEARGLADGWAMIMACLGFMVLYGSLRPKRKCRQIGLALSMLSLFAVFGEVLHARALTLSTLIVLVLAGVALVLFIGDAVIGNRERCRAQGT